MQLTKLTKKEISGYGHYHIFTNDTTGEVVRIKCTEEEYARMGLPDGEKHNPKLTGHTWFGSAGGAPEVDGRLPVPGEYFVNERGKEIANIGGVIAELEPGDLDKDSNFVGEIKRI